MSSTPPPTPPKPVASAGGSLTAAPSAPPVPQLDGAAPLPPNVDTGEQHTEAHKHGGGGLANPVASFIAGAGTSFLLHLSIIIAGILLIEPVRDQIAGLMTTEEQAVIPEAELATDTPGGIQNPGMNLDASRAAAQSIDSSITQSDAIAQTKSETLSQTLTANSGEAPAAIAVGGTNTGLSSGASGGALAKFGVPGGGGPPGPKGAVFGNGGNAYKIVFICDGTGTMGDKIGILRRELLSTISKLKPVQQYNVIFYRDGKNQEVVSVSETLMYATPANKEKTEAFLKNLSIAGDTDPTPAIEKAFKMKPQLVYLLSDGAFDRLKTYDQVVKLINDLNKAQDPPARVNTILFQNLDNTQGESPEQLKRAAQVMEQIANANGGKFVQVDIRRLYSGQ